MGIESTKSRGLHEFVGCVARIITWVVRIAWVTSVNVLCGS